MARYDPSKTFSIAARAAAKLRAVGTRDEAEVSVPLHGIPQDGMPSKSIPQAGIPSDGIPHDGIPTVPLELPARGWVKAANWLFDDLPATLTGYQWIVYMHLYRLSAGFNSPSCRIGYGGLARRTGLCRNAVINNISELRACGLLEVGDTNQEGTLFFLRVPAGIADDGIPAEGIPSNGIPLSTTPSMPSGGIPRNGIPGKPQPIAGVPSDGIPPDGHIKDKGTIQYNTQTKAVLEYLRSEGLTVPEAIIKGTVSRYGYTVDELRLLLTEIRTWADNPTGAMIQAMNEGRHASAATREAAAAAEESQRQQDATVQEEQTKSAWLAAEKKRLGERGLAKLREEVAVRAEREGDYVLKRSRNPKARADHVSGLVDAAILARYNSPS